MGTCSVVGERSVTPLNVRPLSVTLSQIDDTVAVNTLILAERYVRCLSMLKQHTAMRSPSFLDIQPLAQNKVVVLRHDAAQLNGTCRV